VFEESGESFTHDAVVVYHENSNGRRG